VISVLELESQALHAAAQRIQLEPRSQEGILKAVKILQEALEKGRKIVVTGIGKSGKIGEKIAATLSSTGSLAVFLHPTEGLHGDLGIVAEGDCVLAISHTGNTEELIRLIPSLKARKARILALCGHSESRLVKASDAWIDSGITQEACPHNLAPTSSTTLALALGDAIAVSLMRLRGFDAQAFARNHPGGSLGARLTLTVADLMHPIGEDVFSLPLNATMDEVLLTTTRQKLGAVLISSKDGSLAGLITDGDIRRALSHRERFFNLRAEEVMTRAPITTHPEELAWTALEKMENRPSQINVLPVLQADGKAAGLLRLHDLVRTL
jgi:arabinose-5-phosphate isomerase